LIGGDLIKFIKSNRTNKYFSPQTKKQIDIGMEIASMAAEEVSEKNDAFDVINIINETIFEKI
jgi:hypothetical protein